MKHINSFDIDKYYEYFNCEIVFKDNRIRLNTIFSGRYRENTK